MDTNTDNIHTDIITNSITLGEMQIRLRNWQKKVEPIFHGDYSKIPKSILIPLSDLKNIIDGFSHIPLHGGYNVTHARLYFTMDDLNSDAVSGVIVPYGAPNHSPHTGADIVIDVHHLHNHNIHNHTHISAYNFTKPCPPMGNCAGTSELFGEQKEE